MDLHSDHPYWTVRNGLVHVYPPLEKNFRCDAAIVGGGVTGAVLVNALAGADVTCAVIDRRDIGNGSTSASTALLQYEIDTPLHELIARIGKRPAERAYRLGVKAIHRIKTLSSAIECGFSMRPSLLLARNATHLKLLERELLGAGRGFELVGREGAAVGDGRIVSLRPDHTGRARDLGW